MYKSALLIIFALVVVCCTKPLATKDSSVENKTFPVPETPENTQYSVYDAILAQLISENPQAIFVIERNTSKEYNQNKEFLAKNLPEVSVDTIDNFLDKNEESSALKGLFKQQFVFITDEEMKEIFKGPDGWDRFRQIYPQSDGITEFSDVGLNREMNQALVYIGHQRHWLDGIGRIAFLVKEDGNWKVKREINIWFS